MRHARSQMSSVECRKKSKAVSEEAPLRKWGKQRIWNRPLKFPVPGYRGIWSRPTFAGQMYNHCSNSFLAFSTYSCLWREWKGRNNHLLLRWTYFSYFLMFFALLCRLNGNNALLCRLNGNNGCYNVVRTERTMFNCSSRYLAMSARDGAYT